MKRFAVLAVVAGVLVAPAAAQAEQTPFNEAAFNAVVPCWGGAHEWGLGWKVKPKRCMFNGGGASAYATPMTGMTWSSWGGKTACGHGYLRANSGYKTRASFCLYDRSYGDGYGRIRGKTSTRACSYLPSGKRGCYSQRVYRFDNSTA